MAKEVPIEKMDEFCDRVFRALDRAGLLPDRLNAAAHSFEKYGRILAGLLERYTRVEAAFEEWETRALRGVDKWRREAAYPHFQELRAWLTDEENRIVFEGEGRKDNLNHFKRSLYGRLYTWLYPRRKLAVAYAEEYAGQEEKFEPDVITDSFAATVALEVDEMEALADRAAVLADAQAFTIANRHYFRGWKPSVTTVEEEV